MNPWLEGTIKELLPVISDLKDQRPTNKQMLIAKTSSHTTEIKYVPANTEKIKLSIVAGKSAKVCYKRCGMLSLC